MSLCFRLGTLILLIVSLSSCARKSNITFACPNAQDRAVVIVKQAPNIEVLCRSGSSQNSVLRRHKEFVLNFASVYWSPDGSKMAAVVLTGGRMHKLAWDFQTASSLPFDQFASKISGQIRKEYGLSLKTEPLEWAEEACCRMDIQDRFAVLHRWQ